MTAGGSARRLLPGPSLREWRALRAALRLESILAVRRYENLFVTLGLPLLLVVALGPLGLIPIGGGDAAARLERLVPGVVAASIMATAFVALGISTAFERAYGVQRRFAASPFPAWTLVAAKVIAVAVTILLQVALLAIVATLAGWRPPAGLLVALGSSLPWVALGTVCFASLGLLLAARLRPEGVLAVVNGLFVLALLAGGLIVPARDLPGPFALIAALLPPGLLAEAMRATLAGASVPSLVAVVLAGWTALAAAAAFAARPSDD